MKTNVVRNSEKKMLGALSLLYEAGFLTNRLGLAKVIRGKEDEETLPVAFLRCFGYAPSLSNKLISRRLLSLEKKGMVEIKEERGVEGLIFLTKEGQGEANLELFPSPSLRKKKKPNIIRYQ